MLRKALFPISLSNSRFSTEVALAALSPIIDHYDEVVFILADQLQLYNKAAHVTSARLLPKEMKRFESKRHAYLEERSSWLRSVRSELEKSRAPKKWVLYSVDDVTDLQFFLIYRRVLVAFHTVERFRRDVRQAAEDHLEGKESSNSPDMLIRLSEAYILEEISLSVRLHVLERVECEFYVGRHLRPILNVYAGIYGLDAFDLADVVTRDIQFQFFEYSLGDQNPKWLKIELPSSPQG